MKLRMLGWALIRRWYMSLAGLALAGVLCFGAYNVVPVDYKASGSIVLLPSAQSVGAGGNPYLFLGGLSQAMDVLTRRMGAPDTQTRLAGAYKKTTYTALPDVTAGSSILVVAVRARSSDDASRALASVLADVPSELTSMQDELHIPAGSRITSMPVTSPTPVIADTKLRFQAVVGVGALGIILSVLMTALADGLLLRRSSRRTALKPGSLAVNEAGAGHKDIGPQLVSVQVSEISHADEPAEGGAGVEIGNASRVRGAHSRTTATP